MVSCYELLLVQNACDELSACGESSGDSQGISNKNKAGNAELSSVKERCKNMRTLSSIDRLNAGRSYRAVMRGTGVLRGNPLVRFQTWKLSWMRC